MDANDPVRTYYRAIDEGAYDDLAAVLAATVVHDRPDRTLEGRERFVRFMREERPDRETTHDVEAVFTGDPGVAVQGCLRGADGESRFGFVDVFTVTDGRIASIRTYAR